MDGNGNGSGTTTNTTTMATTANNFEGVAGDLGTMLTRLLTEVATAEPLWRGLGGAALQRVMAQWTERQDVINKLLLETAGLIRTSGTNYAGTDQNAAANVVAMGGGGTVPLAL